MTTEHIENYVKYNEEHSVLICIPHGYSLIPGDGIGRHFQRYHGSISIETRKNIAEYAATLILKDPDDVVHPDSDEGPIEGLKLEENGFSCIYEDCDGYVCGTKGTMEQHCRDAHNWKLNDGIMWRKQAVQKFFAGIIF